MIPRLQSSWHHHRLEMRHALIHCDHPHPLFLFPSAVSRLLPSPPHPHHPRHPHHRHCRYRCLHYQARDAMDKPLAKQNFLLQALWIVQQSVPCRPSSCSTGRPCHCTTQSRVLSPPMLRPVDLRLSMSTHWLHHSHGSGARHPNTPRRRSLQASVKSLRTRPCCLSTGARLAHARCLVVMAWLLRYMQTRNRDCYLHHAARVRIPGGSG